MASKGTEKGDVFFNLNGAADLLGKSPSSIANAIETGDLEVLDKYRGARDSEGWLIRPEELRAYRDRLVARLETYSDEESRKDAARLKAIRI